MKGVPHIIGKPWLLNYTLQSCNLSDCEKSYLAYFSRFISIIASEGFRIFLDRPVWGQCTHNYTPCKHSFDMWSALPHSIEWAETGWAPNPQLLLFCCHWNHQQVQSNRQLWSKGCFQTHCTVIILWSSKARQLMVSLAPKQVLDFTRKK